jgi:hypothetical protein
MRPGSRGRPPKRIPTPTDVAILREHERYFAEYHCAPTMRHLAFATRRTLSVVKFHIDWLASQGYLAELPGKRGHLSTRQGIWIEAPEWIEERSVAMAS